MLKLHRIILKYKNKNKKRNLYYQIELYHQEPILTNFWFKI